MRGGNVLNSKPEYTSCKIPRLVINRENWEVNSEAKEENGRRRRKRRRRKRQRR
jgi:hypothetical protein